MPFADCPWANLSQWLKAFGIIISIIRIIPISSVYLAKLLYASEVEFPKSEKSIELFIWLSKYLN